MAIQLLPTEKATAAQMRRFLAISNLEVGDKATKDQCLNILAKAGLPVDHIYVEKDRKAGVHYREDDAPEAVGFTGDHDEHWTVLRISPDPNASEETPVFSSVNDDSVYINVGRVVCIRERHYSNLKDAVYDHLEQKEGTQLREAKVKKVDRYPTQFIGYAGLVKDGPPQINGQPLDPDVEVYRAKA